MADVPNTFSDLIDKWGIGPFAAALGVSYPTANAMKQRNSVPVKYWSLMLGARVGDLPPLTTDRLLALQIASAAAVAAKGGVAA